MWSEERCPRKNCVDWVDDSECDTLQSRRGEVKYRYFGRIEGCSMQGLGLYVVRVSQRRRCHYSAMQSVTRVQTENSGFN